jgi:hypothetical protein
MTITSNILRRDYTANGVNTSYAFDFPIFYESNATPKFSLEVIVADTTGAETTKIETTDYTITYNTTDYVNGVINQGNVVFNTAPANNYTISLLRKVNFTQNNDITTSGSDALPGTALEGSLDKLTLMLLEQKESLNRVFKLPKSSLLDNIEFPIGASQANQVITVNNAGDNLTTKDLADVGLAPVSTYIKTLLDDTTASQARATLDVQQLNANAIINGDLNIWQRGETFNSVADNSYTADRWLYLKNGTMVHDITKSSDVPTVAAAGRLFTSSLKIDCQTSQASIGAGNYALIEQRIEGYNFLPLAQKPITLSFWVKATKTGVYSACLTNSGNNRAYVAEITITSSNTWEKKTITIPASPASGTWDYTNGIGLSLKIHLACGSNFHGLPNSWLTSFAGATANQVNACDSTSNDFFITGVQLEEGDVATPFENRTFADELRLCQRYFEKSWDYLTPVGTADEVQATWGNISSDTTLFMPNNSVYKQEKRATPTVGIYNTLTGSAGSFIAGVTTMTVANVYGGTKGFGRVYSTVGATAYTYARCHWTSTIEL